MSNDQELYRYIKYTGTIESYNDLVDNLGNSPFDIYHFLDERLNHTWKFTGIIKTQDGTIYKPGDYYVVSVSHQNKKPKKTICELFINGVKIMSLEVAIRELILAIHKLNCNLSKINPTQSENWLSIDDYCSKHNIPKSTFYSKKDKYFTKKEGRRTFVRDE